MIFAQFKPLARTPAILQPLLFRTRYSTQAWHYDNHNDFDNHEDLPLRQEAHAHTHTHTHTHGLRTMCGHTWGSEGKGCIALLGQIFAAPGNSIGHLPTACHSFTLAFALVCCMSLLWVCTMSMWCVHSVRGCAGCCPGISWRVLRISHPTTRGRPFDARCPVVGVARSLGNRVGDTH